VIYTFDVRYAGISLIYKKPEKNNLVIFISPDEFSMRINERISHTVVIILKGSNNGTGH